MGVKKPERVFPSNFGPAELCQHMEEFEDFLIEVYLDYTVEEWLRQQSEDLLALYRIIIRMMYDKEAEQWWSWANYITSYDNHPHE